MPKLPKGVGSVTGLVLDKGSKTKVQALREGRARRQMRGSVHRGSPVLDQRPEGWSDRRQHNENPSSNPITQQRRSGESLADRSRTPNQRQAGRLMVKASKKGVGLGIQDAIKKVKASNQRGKLFGSTFREAGRPLAPLSRKVTAINMAKRIGKKVPFIGAAITGYDIYKRTK